MNILREGTQPIFWQIPLRRVVLCNIPSKRKKTVIPEIKSTTNNTKLQAHKLYQRRFILFTPKPTLIFYVPLSTKSVYKNHSFSCHQGNPDNKYPRHHCIPTRLLADTNTLPSSIESPMDKTTNPLSTNILMINNNNDPPNN